MVDASKDTGRGGNHKRALGDSERSRTHRRHPAPCSATQPPPVSYAVSRAGSRPLMVVSRWSGRPQNPPERRPKKLVVGPSPASSSTSWSPSSQTTTATALSRSSARRMLPHAALYPNPYQELAQRSSICGAPAARRFPETPPLRSKTGSKSRSWAGQIQSGPGARAPACQILRPLLRQPPSLEQVRAPVRRLHLVLHDLRERGFDDSPEVVGLLRPPSPQVSRKRGKRGLGLCRGRTDIPTRSRFLRRGRESNPLGAGVVACALYREDEPGCIGRLCYPRQNFFAAFAAAVIDLNPRHPFPPDRDAASRAVSGSV